jgi:hypothetical protein
VVLRVDELEKLGGTPCRQLRPQGGGCGIHARRPQICRSYECLWLRGGLREEDRPDRLGAVVDLDPSGGALHLAIRQAEAGCFDRSPRLREIAEAYREIVPVHVTDVVDVMDADRPFRILLAGGLEHRVAGDLVRVHRDGELVGERRLSRSGRLARRLLLGVRRIRLRRLRAGGDAP